MKTEWKTVKLQEICESISDGDHLPPPKAEKGIPFVTISNIQDNQLDFTDTMFVPESYYEKLDNKRKAKTGDILYSVVGSFGIPVLMKSDEKFVFQRHIAILRPNQIDSRFLYYTMLGKDFYAKADAAAIGAAQRTVSLTSLRNIEISVPPLEIQQKIAGILSAYDDLIENNRKQIKLLEEAAQKLYKEWFVKLNFPGHENVKIVDGVPEDWETFQIDKIYQIKYGNTLPKTELISNGKYPVYGANGVIGRYNKFNVEEIITLITSRGNAGDISYTKDKYAFITNNSFTVKPQEKFEYINFPFIYEQFNMINFHAITTGVAQPQLTNASISNLKICLPNRNFIEKYSNLAKNYFEKIIDLYKQTQLLQEARDKLLPQLMNGELFIIGE